MPRTLSPRVSPLTCAVPAALVLTAVLGAPGLAGCGGSPIPPASGPTHGKPVASAPPPGAPVNPHGQWVSNDKTRGDKPKESGPTAGTVGEAPSGKPKLLLVVVLDQFRADFLTRFEPYFGDSGFRRLMRRGATWTGHYGHYVTYTGPGHALMLSGSYPYVNGIGANKFWNADTQRSEAMVFDGASQVLGLSKTDPDMDVSPRNFVGSTVGDELFLATGGQSKTVSLATKGRGAILLGGRLGKTYFLSDDSGEMTSSSYYMKALPDWVKAWNGKKPADAAFGKTWDRFLPPGAYAVCGQDDPAFKADAKGLGKQFPHKVDGKLKAPGPDFYEAFTHTPWANDYELDFAKAAVEGERLGARGVTDVLAISISAIDLAGHDYGPQSPEVMDLVVRTDRQLGTFLDWLYAHLGGEDEVLTLVSADHGATPIPEQMAALGFEAGRIKKKTIQEAVDGALSKRFGAGKWVVALEDPHVFLDRKLIASKKLDPAAVERAAGEAALTLKGFGGFYTRSQLLAGEVPPTELAKSLVRSYHAGHGGDVMLWTLPFYFWGKYGEKDQGSTHGTAYRYDAEVPVLLMGSGVRPGKYGVREMVDVAPTLSYLLGLVAPAGSEGDVVPLY